MRNSACVPVFSLFLLTGQAPAGETIIGAGATFPCPAHSAWAFTCQKSTGVRRRSPPDHQQNRRIWRIRCPLTFTELEKKDLLQFPAIIGVVVPVVNMRGVKSGELKLTPTILAKLFLGEITQ